MDDAASTIRQYVAAQLLGNPGYFRLLSGSFRKLKLAGATVVASNWPNLTVSRAILQAFNAYFLV